MSISKATPRIILDFLPFLDASATFTRWRRAYWPCRFDAGRLFSAFSAPPMRLRSARRRTPCQHRVGAGTPPLEESSAWSLIHTRVRARGGRSSRRLSIYALLGAGTSWRISDTCHFARGRRRVDAVGRFSHLVAVIANSTAFLLFLHEESFSLHVY